MVGTARMNRIIEVDPENRLALVQPGVINAHLTQAADPYGLYYAPDPSSQSACTLGGNVAENSIANFFIVRDGAIVGPPDRNVLQGVTRKTIGVMAAGLGIPIVEQDLTMYDIAQADECLLSSSGFGVYPVRAVDRFIPKAPVPGPVALQLLDAFAEEAGFDYRTAADAQR